MIQDQDASHPVQSATVTRWMPVVGVVVIVATGFVVARSVWSSAAPAALADRAASRKQIRDEVDKLDAAEIASIYDRDSAQVVDATLTLPSGVRECRVMIADASAVGELLSSRADQGPAALVDAALPIEIDRASPAGAFRVEPAPIGHKIVWMSASGCAPCRIGFNLVGDGVGVVGAQWRLAPERRQRVELLGSWSRWWPVYEGCWPEESWHLVADRIIEVEWRDPDGWPAGLLLDEGNGNAQLMVLAEQDGVLRATVGPESRQVPSIDGQGAWGYRTWEALTSRRRAAAHGPEAFALRINGVARNGLVFIEGEGCQTWAFADRWGTVDVPNLTGGGYVCWAVGRDGHLGSPAGVWVNSGIAEIWCPRPLRFERAERALELGLHRRFSSVYGFLLDANSKPVANSTIVAFSLSHSEGRRHTTSNALGFFSFDNLTPGSRYQLFFDVSGVSGSGVIELTADSATHGARLDLLAR